VAVLQRPCFAAAQELDVLYPNTAVFMSDGG
jgi:hypothetical protein